MGAIDVKAAILSGAAAVLNATICAMQADNLLAAAAGRPPVHSPDDFADVVEASGLREMAAALSDGVEAEPLTRHPDLVRETQETLRKAVAG